MPSFEIGCDTDGFYSLRHRLYLPYHKEACNSKAFLMLDPKPLLNYNRSIRKQNFRRFWIKVRRILPQGICHIFRITKEFLYERICCITPAFFARCGL